jgi:hypothetical protein
MCQDKYSGIRIYEITAGKKSSVRKPYNEADDFFVAEAKASREFKKYIETTIKTSEVLE